MAFVTKNEIKYDHFFDQKANRHYINNLVSVFHCHHYTSLYTQLAIDAGESELLKECARESFHNVLKLYFTNNPDINSLQAKIEIGCQYYALLGLGNMKVIYLGENSGEVELTASHTDSGWLKKWGIYDKPINYITCGFIEALFETVLNLPIKSFKAIETQSIVMGADTSNFTITRN